MAKKLNIKHKAFADEWLSNGMIDYKAYMSVYKSVKSEAGARASASKLLTNPNIQEYIASKQEKTAKKLDIKREDIVSSLARKDEIFNTLLSLSLKEKLTESEESQFRRLQSVIKGSDANKAIETLLKMNGWDEPNTEGDESKEYDINITIKKKDKPKEDGD